MCGTQTKIYTLSAFRGLHILISPHTNKNFAFINAISSISPKIKASQYTKYFIYATLYLSSTYGKFIKRYLIKL